MKPFLTSVGLLFISLISFANPNPDPQVFINELKINNSSDWVMELRFAYLTFGSVDSMFVQSVEGSARVINVGYVISIADLNHTLQINPSGDVVSIVLWCGYYPGMITAEVRFGNVANPMVFAPTPDQSIARPRDEYNDYSVSLDNSPSIGLNNDTAGMCCTLYGKIYDKDGLPVSNQWFLLDNSFTTTATGDYTTRVFSRITTWNTINVSLWHALAIDPVSYSLRPDSVIQRNIHLIDTLLAGMPGLPSKPEPIMKLFPNPVTDYLTLTLNTDISDPVFSYNLVITDLTGRVIRNFSLDSFLGVVNLPANFSKGNYIARLEGDGRLIQATRFIVL